MSKSSLKKSVWGWTVRWVVLGGLDVSRDVVTDGSQVGHDVIVALVIVVVAHDARDPVIAASVS